MSRAPASKTSRGAQILGSLGIAAVLATPSTFVWLEITRTLGRLQMDVSMLSPIMWLGFLFVLWPASAFFARFLGRRDTSNAAIAFLPVGCVLLASGLTLNYAQFRQRSQPAEASFIVPDRGYQSTLADIAAG